MIISHRYRYLFVELPHTGSSAISTELRELYDGSRTLYKHAHYSEFAHVATPDERSFFVFSCIRNPLDEAVSVYQRYVSDHKNAYSTHRKWVKQADIKMFQWIRETGADFPAFFRRAYRRPYDNWSSSAHHKFDYVIRFENLAQDFATVLQRLGIDQARPLPVVNRTSGKDQGFAAYYTPDIIPQARRVFGPFMRKWHYAFPADWGGNSVPRTAQLEFQARGMIRRLYWRHLRTRLPTVRP